MNILTIALKDLKQIMRDRMSALFLVIMPLMFTYLMGMMFGGNQQTDTRLQVGLLNHDENGQLTQLLVDELEDSSAIKLLTLAEKDETGIADQINSGKLAGALIIPAGYSQGLSGQEATRITVIANPAGTTGQSVNAELVNIISRFMGSLETARISQKVISSIKPTADPQVIFLESVDSAMQAWQDPSVSVTTEAVSAAANKSGFSGYVQTSPGMLLQFAIGGLIGAAAVMTMERRNRTVARLLTAPVSKAEVILGHLLGTTLVVFIQEGILILAGQFLFKVDYLRVPAATLLMMLAVALFCGSLGLFLGAISRRPEHAIMGSLLAMFVLTALGGAWFPLEGTSPTFNAIGHATPGAWVMDGFQNIVLRGLGFESVLLPCAILLGYAFLFFALAVWRYKFE